MRASVALYALLPVVLAVADRGTDEGEKRVNRLIDETSPYLLQHARNPVDWYPWGPEAMAKASKERKPIFLSIGYSACHWCHVMERESFENEEIAALLNRDFVPIKVDREERPDLDDIYMTAVQMMSGQGGWPMSVFLTPDGKPFYGGTYYPPDDRFGRPGFKRVLTEIAAAWKDRRESIGENADRLVEALRRGAAVAARSDGLTREPVDAATAYLRGAFDPVWGGFGRAPKFPPAGSLAVLLRGYRETGDPELLAMATTTLDRMAQGGMYDQLGGGFHRYSVDAQWRVPHFEKMLYDNALLAGIYLDAYQVTGKELYRRIATETLDYVLRDMTGAEGAYYSTEDADSEGEEGKFYVWTPAELREALGEAEAGLFARRYGVTGEGNFEGKAILTLAAGIEDLAREENVPAEKIAARLERSHRILLGVRSKRVRPGLDDKVLVSWNGMMIGAMARGYRVLGERRYLESAERAAAFIVSELLSGDELLHTWRNGTAKLPAYLDGYAHLANAFVDLYESGFDPKWLHRADSLVAVMRKQFEDPEGGFRFTSERHGELLARTRPYQDGAVPSGNAVAALALLRVGSLLDRPAYTASAERTLKAAGPAFVRYPRAFMHLLHPLDWLTRPNVDVALVGDPASEGTKALLAAVRAPYRPIGVVALRDPNATAGGISLLAGKGLVDGRPAAYVCRDSVCRKPVTLPGELGSLLARDAPEAD
jgi:uncharacterized protein